MFTYEPTDVEYYHFLTPEERHTIPFQRLRIALEHEDTSGVAREIIEAHPGTLDGFSTQGEGRPVQCVPIEMAASSGDIELVRWLLGRGAAADARRDGRGGTALRGAAEQAAKAWTLDDPGVAKLDDQGGIDRVWRGDDLVIGSAQVHDQQYGASCTEHEHDDAGDDHRPMRRPIEVLPRLVVDVVERHHRRGRTDELRLV